MSSLGHILMSDLLSPICSCINFIHDSTLLGDTIFTPKVFLHEISLLFQGSCIAIGPEFLNHIRM